jgi:hypothetical protein
VSALRGLDAIGEEGAIEIAASSFGADRPGAFPIRMGGDIGRLVPLMNERRREPSDAASTCGSGVTTACLRPTDPLSASHGAV